MVAFITFTLEVDAGPSVHPVDLEKVLSVSTGSTGYHDVSADLSKPDNENLWL